MVRASGCLQQAAGSEVVMHSASLAFINNNLGQLPVLVHLSRVTRNFSNQNSLIASASVLGRMTRGALKFIPPVFASVLHVVGSWLVIFNGFGLMRMDEDLEAHELCPTRGAQGENGDMQLQPAHP
jgi:cation transport ATPase